MPKLSTALLCLLVICSQQAIARLQSGEVHAWEVQEITFLPQTMKELSPEDLPMFEKFINMLNDCEDVQDVYHNVDLPS